MEAHQYIYSLYLNTQEPEILALCCRYFVEFTMYFKEVENFACEEFLLKLESTIKSTDPIISSSSISILHNILTSEASFNAMNCDILHSAIEFTPDNDPEEKLYLQRFLLKYELSEGEILDSIRLIAGILIENQDDENIQINAVKLLHQISNVAPMKPEIWNKVEEMFSEDIIIEITHYLTNEMTCIEAAAFLAKLAIFDIKADLIIERIGYRLQIIINTVMDTRERYACLLFYWSILKYKGLIPPPDTVHRIYDFLDIGVLKEQILAIKYIFLVILNTPDFTRGVMFADSSMDALDLSVFGMHLIEKAFDVFSNGSLDTESIEIISRGVSYLIYHHNELIEEIINDDFLYDQFVEFSENSTLIRNDTAYESFRDIAMLIVQRREQIEKE